MGRKLVINPTREPGTAMMSVSDLIRACNVAGATMSVHNPHRRLVANCARALRQLVDRLAELEGPEGGVN